MSVLGWIAGGAAVATVGTGIIVVGWGIGVYNTFMTIKQDINGQLGDLSAEYQRRCDLFLNLSKIVKKQSAYEKELLTELSAARSGLTTAKDANGKVQRMKQLDKAFGILEMRYEKYPELQAHKSYEIFIEEVRGTENVIVDQRKKYNAITQDANTFLTVFPNNMLAGFFKQYEYEFFVESQYSKEERPVVDMEDTPITPLKSRKRL